MKLIVKLKKRPPSGAFNLFGNKLIYGKQLEISLNKEQYQKFKDDVGINYWVVSKKPKETEANK